MAKIRIFQVAKDLNISHTDILNFLKSKKVKVSSHMSPIDENIHQVILEEFAKVSSAVAWPIFESCVGPTKAIEHFAN